jgi:hypothetical protein
MNFSIGKNDKPDELPSGGCKESRNHIIRAVPNLLHWGANRAGIAMKDAHRYNRVGPKTFLSTVPNHNKTLRQQAATISAQPCPHLPIPADTRESAPRKTAGLSF